MRVYIHTCKEIPLFYFKPTRKKKKKAQIREIKKEKRKKKIPPTLPNLTGSGTSNSKEYILCGGILEEEYEIEYTHG